VICAGAFIYDKCNIDDCQVAAGAIVPANTQAKQEIFLRDSKVT
jgi:carbonic anhydrase/acetyltransferase-like protein (isoleucine patch superfamily)